MSDLKAQAEELGIEVDGRWSDETLQQKIDEALAADPTPDAHPLDHDADGKKGGFVKPEQLVREKTLHELNLEARKIDRALRGLNDDAAEAARKAVSDTLNEKRPDGRRTRKNLRAAV